MRTVLKACLLLVGLSFSPQPGQAITFETQEGWRFGINGFIDAQYTAVEKMPMVDGVIGAPVIISSTATSNISQEHMNLIFSAEKDRVRFFVNFDSHAALSQIHVAGSSNQIILSEAYGELSFGQGWSIRAGQFHSPFSMFNTETYVLPLFSSVNLPLMYRMPGVYHGGVDGIDDSASVRHNLMPDQANLMLSKITSTDTLDFSFKAYLTAGARKTNQPQVDANIGKGFGGRFKVSGEDDVFVVGISGYTVNNDGAGLLPAIENVGREILLGADLTFKLWQDQISFEAEVVHDSFAGRKSRLASSVRLSSHFTDSILGFVGHQYMRDDAHPIFKRGMNVYSVGSTYSWSTNVLFKLEYHFHTINADNTAIALPASTNKFSMFKSSLNFMF